MHFQEQEHKNRTVKSQSKVVRVNAPLDGYSRKDYSFEKSQSRMRISLTIAPIRTKKNPYNSLDFVKNLVGELLGPGAGSFGQLALLSTHKFVNLPFGHFTFGPVDLSFCLLISCFENLAF